MKLIVVTHANRSGSTYLCSQMDRLPGVEVGLESLFVANIIEGEWTVADRSEAESLVESLFQEEKFVAWGAGRSQLVGELVAAAPLDTVGVLRVVLACVFDDPDAAWLLKGSRLHLHMEWLRRNFEGTRFLHIVRDPRAVYASQRKSMGSDRGLPMAAGPISLARNWRYVVGCFDQARRDADSLEVGYEELVSDLEGTMSQVSQFVFGRLVESGWGAGAAYLERIPEAQKPLHVKLALGPDPSRIDAWRQSVPDLDHWLIEQLLSRRMVARGYDREASAKVLLSASALLRLCQVLGLEAGRLFQNARYWLTRAGGLRTLLRRKRAEFRGRSKR